MTEDEIRNILEKNGCDKQTIDDMITTNNKISEEIETAIDLNQALFPNYETPEDVKELYDQYQDTLVEKE